MLRRFFLGFVGIVGLFGFINPAAAATFDLTYHYKHFLFTIPVAKQKQWTASQELWTYNGKQVVPPQNFRVDGDHVPPLPAGFEKKYTNALNRTAIIQTMNDVMSSVNRPAGHVTIGTTASGAVTFEGVGFPGQQIDLEAATDLTIAALNTRTSDIMIPVIETQPTITVTSDTLTKQGIRELVTIGESDFSRSPNNRRHNIAVGLSKFNGHIIPAGSTFSFDETLGPVNGKTGYLKELVIKGDQTLPDYGGGLCQVSSTAYRGVWEYGFPIVKRINHSYMVSHYSPQGTDATVYPPNVDMKFLNDSPGSLLMQTYAVGDNAYFLYYGTKDDRKAEVIGPFTWGFTPPPPDRTQYTLDLAPGEKKKMGERVPGEHAAWFRTTTKNGKEVVQGTYSIYSARPLYYIVGTDKIPTGETGATIPSVFLEE